MIQSRTTQEIRILPLHPKDFDERWVSLDNHEKSIGELIARFKFFLEDHGLPEYTEGDFTLEVENFGSVDSQDSVEANLIAVDLSKQQPVVSTPNTATPNGVAYSVSVSDNKDADAKQEGLEPSSSNSSCLAHNQKCEYTMSDSDDFYECELLANHPGVHMATRKVVWG